MVASPKTDRSQTHRELLIDRASAACRGLLLLHHSCYFWRIPPMRELIEGLWPELAHRLPLPLPDTLDPLVVDCPARLAHLLSAPPKPHSEMKLGKPRSKPNKSPKAKKKAPRQ